MKSQFRMRRLLAWAAAGSAALGAANAQFKAVAAGTDYLQTGAGSQVIISGTPVNLTGVPISPPKYGSTDTIVVRLQDAVFAGKKATIPIEMAALSMQGSLGSCTVSITMAPSPPSTGTMTIVEASPAGGTFTSRLAVNYMAMFTPAATCPAPFSSTVTLTQTGGTWSTKPISTLEFLVKGRYPDVPANKHSGLPQAYRDFFIIGSPSESGAPLHISHNVCESSQQAGLSCESQ